MGFLNDAVRTPQGVLAVWKEGNKVKDPRMRRGIALGDTVIFPSLINTIAIATKT